MDQYVDFGGLLFSMLQKKPAAADIERIVKDAVAIEKAFILEVSQPPHCVQPVRVNRVENLVCGVAFHETPNTVRIRI